MGDTKCIDRGLWENTETGDETEGHHTPLIYSRWKIKEEIKNDGNGNDAALLPLTVDAYLEKKSYTLTEPEQKYADDSDNEDRFDKMNATDHFEVLKKTRREDNDNVSIKEINTFQDLQTKMGKRKSKPDESP